MQAEPVSAEAVATTLESVLARPEFAPPPRSPVSLLIERAFDWVRDRIVALVRWLFPDISFDASLRENLAEIMVALLGVLGLVLLFYLLRLALRTWRTRGRARTIGATADPRRAWTADDWEREARSAAAAERWRDAALALYQAVVHRLAERGIVRLDPSKTPGDYRREARRSPEARGALDSFVRSFEPLAFGNRVADGRSYGQLATLAAPLGARG